MALSERKQELNNRVAMLTIAAALTREFRPETPADRRLIHVLACEKWRLNHANSVAQNSRTTTSPLLLALYR